MIFWCWCKLTCDCKDVMYGHGSVVRMCGSTQEEQLLRSRLCWPLHLKENNPSSEDNNVNMLSIPYQLIHLSVPFPFRSSVRVAGYCRFFPPEGLRGLLGPKPVYSMGVGQGTSWMSRQLIAGPLLMAVAASQGANCTSGATLGFSILLKVTSTCSSVPPQGVGIPTSDLLNQRSSDH